MKKKLIITEAQYKRLKSKLNEGEYFSEDMYYSVVDSGKLMAKNIYEEFKDRINNDEWEELETALIHGIKQGFNTLTYMGNDGDDGMTYDQFGAETHGY